MSAGTLLNTSVGAYRLVDFLGAGGMGEVYRAVHVSLGRVVALKVLTAVSTDPVSLERFRNEARVHAKLQHPNIATLYDFLDLGGRPCIVMEYVDGETLDELVQRSGGLSPLEALRLFAAIADAVAYLHGSGIIHRDIKANNVKIGSGGAVKLLDFGIAKASFSPTLTAIGGVIGTTYYLAPEQLTRGTADARSDVWALGVLLYEMVTGRLPFEGQGLGSLTERIVRAAYPPASQVNPAVPREVEAVIGHCLRRRPEDRYPSGAELLVEVRALLAPRPAEPAPSHAPHAPPALERLAAGASAWLRRIRPLGQRARPYWRRARPDARLVAAGGAALAALLFLLWAIARPGPEPAAPALDTVRGGLPLPVDTGPGALPLTTAPLAPRMQTVHITVRGGPALVYREGRFLNGTPFDLRETVGERVRLTLERAGYQPLRVEFTVTEGQPSYEFELTPLPSLTVPGDTSAGASPGLLLMLPFGWFRRRRASGRANGAGPGRGTELPVTDPGARADPVVDFGVLTDPGCVRETNEDTVRLVAPGTPEEAWRHGLLAVVADGMGGHLAGEVASNLAVDRVVQSYAADGGGDPGAALVRALRQANAAVRRAAAGDATCSGMGTTCTALVIRRGLAYCAHVGDSRLYLLRNGELLQMTEDHSAVMNLVRHGVISRDEARHHPDRNVILRALGNHEELEVWAWPRPFAVRPGDRFLLCSDGLYDLVEEPELSAVVSAGDPTWACRRLVALALERGAPDNVSVAVLAVRAPGTPAPEPAAAPPATVPETRVDQESVP